MLQRINNLLHNKNFRDGSLFTFFSFLNQGLNFLLLIVLSWYILPDSYGKLNLFYTGISIISVLICLCTNGIVGINFFKESKANISRYINIVLFCTLAMSVILCICIIIFHRYIEAGAGIEYKLQFLCIYICALTVVYNLLTDIYRLEEKVIAYGVVTTISTVLNIITTLILVIVLSQDWLGRIHSNAIIISLFFIAGLIILKKHNVLSKRLPSKSQIHETLSYGIPLIPHSLNGFFRQGVDKYIINGIFTTTQVGLFSFSANFSFIIYSIGAAFNRSNSVYIFKCLSENPENAKAKLRKQTWLMIAFFAAITILLNIICAVIFPLLFPTYANAIIYLLPLTLGAFFQCVYLQFCNYIFFFRKTKQLMFITCSVSLLHMGISLWLTQYSVVLTAWVSMISSSVEAILVYLYSRKLYKVI